MNAETKKESYRSAIDLHKNFSVQLNPVLNSSYKIFMTMNQVFLITPVIVFSI